MKCKKEMMRLYAVTDRSWVGRQTLLEQVEAAIKGGATLVQLREKGLDEETFLAEAVAMRALCTAYGVPLIINDNVEIALKCRADGVHVGQKDMEAGNVRALVGEDMMIGVSAQTLAQAQAAEAAGADYLGVGAVFPTTTKLDAREVTHETLKEICAAVHIPVVAIGGIKKENISQLAESGVDGVALVSAIFAARDIENECRELKMLSEKMVGGQMKTALSIAGSDSCGGAGIQADIKTMTMNGVYAMSAVTALTAQNTTGVSDILEVEPRFLQGQIDAVFTDIFPDAVKIGMVSSARLVEVIARRLAFYKAKNIVVDPVMVATSGSRLMRTDAVDTLIKELLPLATLVTPNIPEAEILSGMKVQGKEDMEEAARRIGDAHGCAVLLKGGHDVNDANDFLYADGKCRWFEGKRIDNPNTHGTGCTLSSAIAANLAKGFDLELSVARSKEYVSGALSAMLDLGRGCGPMNHAFDLGGRFSQRA